MLLFSIVVAAVVFSIAQSLRYTRHNRVIYTFLISQVLLFFCYGNICSKWHWNTSRKFIQHDFFVCYDSLRDKKWKFLNMCTNLCECVCTKSRKSPINFHLILYFNILQVMMTSTTHDNNGYYSQCDTMLW